MSKVLKKPQNKRSKLDAAKQKLISKINKCKKFSELKKWKKTMDYYPVLSEDNDWDFCFFLDLIEFKLKRMAKYFHTHDLVLNEDYYGDLCDRAVKILNAGYKTDIILKDDLKDIYVNTRNIHRFFTPKELDFILKHPALMVYYLPTVREKKAKALFWKFLHHYIEQLWD